MLAAACGENAGAPAAETFELALIMTSLGTIDDKSFNQGAWEGMLRFAGESNISYKYYEPSGQGEEAYVDAIERAIDSGAKVVVTAGNPFEIPIYIVQDRFPDTRFVLLDAEPFNGNHDAPEWRVASNTVSVFYAEEQSGFLAGYAAVMDGYRSLGFMGGQSLPSVVRFGHGFIQGAQYAALELGLDDGAITMNYTYTGVFEPQPEIAEMAASWFDDGVEVIFACGGAIYLSIFPEAEKAGRWAIGVDGDKSDVSPAVITSAMKLLAQSVYDQLAAYYNDSFPGGRTFRYDASNMGVGLPPVSTSRFNSFTQAQYDAVFARLAEGSIVVSDNDNPDDADNLDTPKVVVNYYR